MLILYLESYEELEDYLRSEKDALYRTMFTSIQEADDDNTSIARVLKAYLSSGARIRIDITRDEWKNVLGRCLAWFEETEDYEMCQDIIQLSEKIYGS